MSLGPIRLRQRSRELELSGSQAMDEELETEKILPVGVLQKPGNH
jgi:hypothetical protein